MFGRYSKSPGSIKLVFLLILSVLFSEIPGQYYNIRCQNIGITEGLSDGHINDIIQDEFDYIWIATRRGLYRYDGLNVNNFPIVEDSSNVVYILDGRGGHLMVIKGRGLTGACVPNIFDDMSQKLATSFGD